MTAKNDEARIQLFQESKSTEILLSVLKAYVEMDYKVNYFYNYLNYYNHVWDIL